MWESHLYHEDKKDFYWVSFRHQEPTLEHCLKHTLLTQTCYLFNKAL